MAIAGGSASLRDHVIGDGLVEFDDLQLHADIYDPGTTAGFVAFATVRRRVAVAPTSAARIEQTLIGQPRFPSAQDRIRWRAAGAPVLEKQGTHVLMLPSGAYTFIPQGLPLTYDDVRRLPPSPTAIERIVDAHLAPDGRSLPTAWQRLRAYGFLLGTAPLTRATRSGVFAAMAALPGIYQCGSGRDALRRLGQGVCVDDTGVGIKVLFDARTGSVLAVLVAAVTKQPSGPPTTSGTIVQADTFARPA